MTDQITIPRALLEQALESLWQMTKKFNFERPHESRLSDSNVRVSAHDAMNAIRAELAKPEPEETFIPDWANYRQGVADGKAGSPKWHDAPTEPGLWHVKMHPHSNPASVIEVLVTDVKAVPTHCRWYGPIPQDGEKS